MATQTPLADDRAAYDKARCPVEWPKLPRSRNSLRSRFATGFEMCVQLYAEVSAIDDADDHFLLLIC